MQNLPIIFSAPMVLALLDGRKTMTRRMLYAKRTARNGIIPASVTIMRDHLPPRPPLGPHGFPTDIGPDQYYTLSGWHKVKPGDHLWVRENLRLLDGGFFQYVADRRGFNFGSLPYETWQRANFKRHKDGRIVPSIHMPRWASRLTLEVTATKIERLMLISDDDAKREGIVEDDGSEPNIWYVPGAAAAGWKIKQAGNPAMVFRSLWENLNGEKSWNSNPDVIAVTFKVHRRNIDAMEKAA